MISLTITSHSNSNTDPNETDDVDEIAFLRQLADEAGLEEEEQRLYPSRSSAAASGVGASGVGVGKVTSIQKGMQIVIQYGCVSCDVPVLKSSF